MPIHEHVMGMKEILYLAVCVVILGVAVVAYFYLDSMINKRTYAELITKAASTASLIDPSDVSTLVISEEDLSNPIYHKLKQQITTLRERNTNIRFVYLMAMREGRVYFMLDSEDPSSEDYSPPGQEYEEASPTLIAGWNRGASHVLEIYEDRWGNWVSALAPIVDSSGATIALVGLDQNADTHRIYFLTVAGLIVLSTVALLSIVSVMYLLHRRESTLADMKTDFVAVASHELRSPLTAIRWSLSALRNEASLEPNVREIINDLYRRVCALINLTSTFLLTTSADYGVMRAADFTLFNAAQVLDDAIAHAQALSQMKKIKITTYVEPNSSISIKGDKERVRLVFDNLLSNAIKYSPEGSSIEIYYEEGGNAKIFKIRDHGIGIPKDELKKIFTGFHRAANARFTHAVGSGFGLYMAQKIIRYHGGDITCESEVGKGTTFVVSLPTGV